MTTGQHVLFKGEGYWDDVAVLDFKSMYPTIIVGCNISTENIAIVNLSHTQKPAVTWTDSRVLLMHSDVICSFPRGADGIVPQVMRTLVQTRDKLPKHNPINNAYKVGANCLYGAMGFEHSGMYSPLCSVSVTLVVRWCLVITEVLATRLGLQVIYGDTDSIMVANTPPGDPRPACVCKVVNMVLGNTFFKAQESFS